MTKPTEGPYKLIWHGNETYPYPLSIHTADGNSWIARDGTVSSEANARLLAKSWEMREAIYNYNSLLQALTGPDDAAAQACIKAGRALLRSIEGE